MNRLQKIIFIFLLLAVTIQGAYGQPHTNLDSLQIVWEDTTLLDEVRLEAVMQAALYLWYPKDNIKLGHEIAEKLNEIDTGNLNPKYQSIYYLSKGWVLRDDDIDQSIDTFLQSIELAKQAEFELGIVLGYCHLGLSYLEKGLYNKALEQFEKSLNLYKESDAFYQKSNNAWTLCNMVSLKLEEGKEKEADEYTILTEKAFTDLDDEGSLAQCYIELGRLHSNRVIMLRL